jgi:hypothetical protein
MGTERRNESFNRAMRPESKKNKKGFEMFFDGRKMFPIPFVG